MEKAAIMCGLGSESVWQIGVDKEGRMIISGRTYSCHDQSMQHIISRDVPH